METIIRPTPGRVANGACSFRTDGVQPGLLSQAVCDDAVFFTRRFKLGIQLVEKVVEPLGCSFPRHKISLGCIFGARAMERSERLAKVEACQP